MLVSTHTQHTHMQRLVSYNSDDGLDNLEMWGVAGPKGMEGPQGLLEKEVCAQAHSS